MVTWGKHPEFVPAVAPWRKKLDAFFVVTGIALTLYNVAYVGLGYYYGEIDPDKERQDLRQMDDRINRMIYGKSMNDMSPAFRKFHESISLVDLAAKIREQQQQQPSEKSEQESVIPSKESVPEVNRTAPIQP